MTTSKSLRYILLLLYFNINLCIAEKNQFATLQRSLQSVTISGFTRARQSIPVASEVAGKVTHVFADIGQPVPENGIFACLDDTFINLDINATKNNITRHGIDLKFLTKQVERHAKLVKTNSTAISLYDDLIRQKENVYYTIQSEKIKLQKLQETKTRHCITAPNNWVITQRTIEVGQWVDIGTTLAQADNYKKLLIPFTLTAEELAVLEKKKDNITLYLPESKQQIKARIGRISPAFDEQSHKIRIDLEIQDGLANKRGGIRAELTLEVTDKLNSFLISSNAIDERFEEIWLTRKNGERIRVMLLENLQNGSTRISSSKIKLGDQFKLLP